MTKAYLSLGSNVDPERNLRSAVAALRERFGELLLSPVYRTVAVGFDGDDFLNAAAVIDSNLELDALDDWLHALENAHGRDRSGPRFGNRTLDIDVVFFGDRIVQGPKGLRIPRPELRHAFVLKPLVDLVPGFVDPLSGSTLAALWAASPERTQSMVAIAGFVDA